MGRSDNATVDPYINSMSENMVTSPDGNVNDNFSLSSPNYKPNGNQGTPLNSLRYNSLGSSAVSSEYDANDIEFEPATPILKSSANHK